MNLKKLSPSMVMLLGLGTEACTPCLSPPGEPTGTSSSTASTIEPETGPCLSPPDETFTDSVTGPADSGTRGSSDTGTGSDTAGSGTSTGSGTGTGTGTGTETDAGSDDATTGPCLAPVAVAPDDTPDLRLGSTAAPRPVVETRRAALQRVLDRQALPADVASRLRSTLDD